MEFTVPFYFLVSENAKVAYDEDGSYSSCYMKINLTFDRPTLPDDMDAFRESLSDKALQSAAAILKTDPCNLTLISESEYLSETGE